MTSTTAALLDASIAAVDATSRILDWKYLFPLFVFTLSVGTVLSALIAYRKWREGWLSFLVEKRIVTAKEVSRSSLKKLLAFLDQSPSSLGLALMESIENLFRYLKKNLFPLKELLKWPSAISFVIFLGGVFILFYFSHEDVPYRNFFAVSKWLPFLNRGLNLEEASNVTSIMAGLVGIIFALVIFIAESVRDAKNMDERRVLLKIGNFWFLITFTILALLNFLLFKINILSIVFPTIIGFSAIHAFWRVSKHLMDPDAQETNRQGLLKRRANDIVSDSIRERIANNILLECLGEGKVVQFEYTVSKRWIEGNIQDYFFIESLKEGRISDINIGELRKLSDRLEQYSRKMSFTTRAQQDEQLSPSSNATTMSEGFDKTKLPVKKVYLLKRYGELLPPDSIFTEDSKAILAIPKEFASEKKFVSELQQWVPHIFKFDMASSSSERFRRELQAIKDELAAAIRSESLGAIEGLRENYKELAEVFLEKIHEYGGGFSPEQAKKERTSLSGGWDEVRWLRTDLRELLSIAAASNNRDVIRDIASLPIAIAIRAVQAKDHLLFQEFLDLSTLIYHLSLEKSGDQKSVKDFMAERSWRYIKDITMFYIEPLFGEDEEVGIPERLNDAKDFAIYSLRTFQFLLKAAFDKKDFDNFSVMIDQYMNLYKNLDTKLNRLTADEKKDEVKIAVEEVYLAKQQVLFGLSAKILDKYFQRRDDELLKQFFDKISHKLPTKPQRLTKVYDSSRSHGTRDGWGWDDWEVIADGEAHFIDVESKLDRLYAVQMLKQLATLQDDAIQRIELRHNRQMVFTIDGPLTQLLQSIQSNPETWSFLLHEDARNKIENLTKLLASVKEKQEKEEEEMLKSVQIDPEKLAEFKKEIQDHFEKDGCLRVIAHKLDFYENLTTIRGDEDAPSWGYNQIIEKAGFIKDWHIHYVGRGEVFGGGMAHSEDRAAFDAMINGVSAVTIDRKHVQDEIRKTIDIQELSSPIIIHTLSYPLEGTILHDSKSFIPHYRNDCPKTELDGLSCYQGVLQVAGKSIPVIDLFVDQDELMNKILVIDLKAFGSWKQFSPIKKIEDEMYRFGVCYLKIADLNQDEEQRKKILEEDPTWLQEHADKEGYLRQRVVVHIFERFKIDARNRNAGKCFHITQEQDAE